MGWRKCQVASLLHKPFIVKLESFVPLLLLLTPALLPSAVEGHMGWPLSCACAIFLEPPASRAVVLSPPNTATP